MKAIWLSLAVFLGVVMLSFGITGCSFSSHQNRPPSQQKQTQQLLGVKATQQANPALFQQTANAFSNSGMPPSSGPSRYRMLSLPSPLKITLLDPQKTPTSLSDAIIQEVAFEAEGKQIHPVAEEIIYTLDTPKFGVAVLAFRKPDGTITYFSLITAPDLKEGQKGRWPVRNVFQTDFDPKNKAEWFNNHDKVVLDGETFDGSLQGHPMGLSNANVHFYFNPESVIVATTGPAFSATSQKAVALTSGEKAALLDARSSDDHRIETLKIDYPGGSLTVGGTATQAQLVELVPQIPRPLS